MINLNFLFFTLLFITVCYLLMSFVSRFKEAYYNEYTKQQILNCPELGLKYLDRFYISNIYYTIFSCSCFIFFYSLIFIFWRYLFLGYIYPIDLIVDQGTNIFYIIYYYILFIICLIFYKTLISICFFHQILKLHLWLLKFSLYYEFADYFAATYLEDFFGKFRIFLVRVHKFLPKSDPDDCDIYEQIFENEKIVAFAITCIYWVKKFHFLHKILKYLIILVNFLFLYIQHIISFLPLFIYLLVFIYEIFFMGHLYISYYASFFLLIINMHKQIEKFYRGRSHIDDSIIQKYFYENVVSYEQQRYYIMNEDNIINPYKSYINSRIYQEFTYNHRSSSDWSFINYLFNNLKETPHEVNRKIVQKSSHWIFITYILLFMILISVYITVTQTFEIILFLYDKKINISMLIFNIPLIFIYYFYSKTYVFKEKRERDLYDIEDSTPYNLLFDKKAYYIFLLLCILQLYFYWILMKFHIYNTFEPISIGNILTIIKILTDKEKVKFVFKYLYKLRTKEKSEILQKYFDEIYILILKLDLKEILKKDRTVEDIIKRINKIIIKFLKWKQKI